MSTTTVHTRPSAGTTLAITTRVLRQLRHDHRTMAMLLLVPSLLLGLLASAFARSEFQAVQFMPLVVLPQFFLCGLLVPRGQLPGWLQAVSDVLPLSYAVDALQQVGRSTTPTGTLWRDVAVVAAIALAALALAAATLRRRTS